MHPILERIEGEGRVVFSVPSLFLIPIGVPEPQKQMVDLLQNCVGCGVGFAPCKPWHVYCTKDCRVEAQRRPPIAHSCESCGSGFLGVQGKRFCSTLCGDLLRGTRHTRPSGVVIDCAGCLRRRAVPYRASECLSCREDRGRALEAKRDRVAARKLADALRARQREALRQSRLPVPLGLVVVEAGPSRAIAERPADHLWVGRDCLECGDPFVVRVPRWETFGSPWESWRAARLRLQTIVAAKPTDKFCSVACRRRTERRLCRARRKARKLSGEVIRSREVFERDGWRCHICRKPVKRDAEVPHPRAPTVDHLVPLACGGEHAMRNVQTAHFLCNSVKSAGCANDQLRLV